MYVHSIRDQIIWQPGRRNHLACQHTQAGDHATENEACQDSYELMFIHPCSPYSKLFVIMGRKTAALPCH